MKAKLNLLVVGLLAIFIPGCSQSAEQETTPTEISGHPTTPSAMPQAPAKNPRLAGAIVGTVASTSDTGGYTYVEVDTGKEKVWVAGPVTPVAVGNAVTIYDTVLMQNFHSKTLDRTFETIYFAGMISVAGAGGAAAPAPSASPALTVPAASTADLSVENIAKAEGGKTIGEIFSEKSELAGQSVIVRGKVVKYNSGIMGKNWLHIQDGSAGPEGANDLIVTTAVAVEMGNTVVVQGVLALDKDFGYGYKYDVIIEDASVSVE